MFIIESLKRLGKYKIKPQYDADAQLIDSDIHSFSV